MEHLGPVARGQRKFAGMKYHRITGRSEEKELYDREAAEKAAETHATHFLEQRRQQIREISGLGFDPIVVVPFDAELFGHWWFEGPSFLERFIRKAASEQDLRLTTPRDYLAAHPTLQTIQPAASTWGENGHLSVWLDPSNAWIYPHLHAAARRMSDLARKHAGDVRSARRPRLKATGPRTFARAIERLGVPHENRNSTRIRNQTHDGSSCPLQSIARSVRGKRCR